MQKFFNFYSNKRIAVTGASGFIGSCLLNELSKYSKTAYGISRRKTKIKNLKMLKVNLNNKNDLKNTVKKFDIFFYFAADTNLYRSEKNIMYVDLVTAQKADEELKQKILKSLGNKKVLLNEKINPKILGGVLIRVDDKQFDSTVKSSINKIKSSFKI